MNVEDLLTASSLRKQAEECERSIREWPEWLQRQARLLQERYKHTEPKTAEEVPPYHRYASEKEKDKRYASESEGEGTTAKE